MKISFFLKTIALIALIALFALCAPQEAAAQSARGNYNFLDFQQKPYYFGITLAYNRSNYKLFQSEEFIGNDSIRLVESVNGPGFNLGIVTNLKIGRYFDIRFLPTLSFAERKINYSAPRSETIQPRRIESVLVEMPFHARYKSEPFNDIRLFVIGGVKYSFDVANDARARNSDDLVKVAPTDFALEVGAGAQFFFPYFIFSPELKFSHGLGNTLIFDENLEESRVIDKILSRTFTVSFHFEG